MKYWIPISGMALLTSSSALALNIEYPHYTKALEVYFYFKKSNQERIKIWIEDLGNLSKVQYYDSSSNSWKKLSWEKGEKYKKYAFLSSLANYYIQVQHWINIVNHLKWLGENPLTSIQGSNICCQQGSVGCACNQSPCPTGCTSSNCNNKKIIKNQKLFSLYLTNLASAKGNIYFTPIQVHIKLSETENFDNLTQDNSQEKSLIGSMVYGFVDYYYKPLDSGFENDFYKSIKPDYLEEEEEEEEDNKKYYYANYPQLFKFKYDKGKMVEGTGTNLLNIHKDLKNKKNLLKEYKTSSSSQPCNDMSCIISRNYIQKEEQLSQIQTNVKSSTTCASSS